MLRWIYLAGGGLLIAGYLGWSALGWELGSSRKEPVPTIRATSSSGYYGRSRSGYYGGGYGFGK